MPPNTYWPPPSSPTITVTSQSKKKKPAVLWDKDGSPDGLSSIQILYIGLPSTPTIIDGEAIPRVAQPKWLWPSWPRVV
ncbi:hypothetical protein PGTUg99_018342 [Puccinia graminis f. sp. tritici]|uniref:Uncharacterized protein n=1 Tax=Puccinia graminis f. sp. tritici TaxID=56615 RepID=A0A5B0R7P6_PUCGR|nr:hypothetical protein PGTUg99_018342 [Puccinia graminis f. sp. tritici]